MLSLLIAVALVQQTPDTSLRLLPGDQWTSEFTYRFEGDDIDLTHVEATAYSVAKEGNRTVLAARWKLVQSKIDGQIALAPKGIEPITLKVGLDGESLTKRINEDVARHRIERVLQIDRKGTLTELSFFPPPPNVRLVGLEKRVGMAPRSKEVIALAAWETAGDKPIRAEGHYTLDPTTGILNSGMWTIENCPIPGGDSLCLLTVTLKVKDQKLAPRG